jgi:hypothetical protein
MEIAMWCRLSIAGAAALMMGVVGATAAELPIYEVMGFPITPHQFAVVGAANVEEQSGTPTLTLGGMPASPHQVAVLTPHPRMAEQQATAKSVMIGLSAK